MAKFEGDAVKVGNAINKKLRDILEEAKRVNTVYSNNYPIFPEDFKSMEGEIRESK